MLYFTKPNYRCLPLFLLIVFCLRNGWADEQFAEIIIVGAGLSGLSSAFYLKKAGKTALILEASPHIGGRVRTASYANGNNRAEIGLEEFWAGNPVLDIFRQLDVPLETSYNGISSFYSQGVLHPFTQDSSKEFLETIFSITELKAYHLWDKKMQELSTRLEQHPLPADLLALKDVAFADWLQETNGLPEKVLDFIRIETEPEYGTSWQQISALDGIAEWRYFSGRSRTPYHVQGGNQRGMEAIADFIGRDDIRLNQQVTVIKSTDHDVEVTAIDPGNFREHRYRCHTLISTVPLYRLNDIQFLPPLSKDRKLAVQTQAGGAYFTAHLIVDHDAARFWSVNGLSILPILTDSILGVIYEGKSVSGKDVVLNLLITGTFAEQFNTRITSLDDVRQTLLAAFEKLWPGFGQTVKNVYFYRYHPRAIASWPVGRSRFDALSESLRKPQGRILFAGDFTEDSHSDGAAASAIRAVGQILQNDPEFALPHQRR